MKDDIFSFYCNTKIYMGINSHEKLKDILDDLKISKIFVVVDSFVLNSHIFSSIKEIFNCKKVTFDVFSEVEPDPSSTSVSKAFNLYRKSEAPVVLAIGGGSTIDTAKSVGILARNGGQIKDYEGMERFSNPPLPLIAIPTTAGTGSEVSASCTIIDAERGLKMSIRHPAFNPAKIAILDPIALKTLPGEVAAHAAVDAFVHAFESYISLNANPITDAMNLYSMELISRNIRQFISNRANLEAGLNMAIGSNLAGITFGLTGLGNVHCMARFIGAFCHISHGLSNAVCLPVAAEFNLLANPKKYARVAVALGENVQGLSEMEAGHKTIRAIKSMCADLGIPNRLSAVGATKEMLAEMANLSFNAGYNKWNPRYTTYEDFLNLFQLAY